MTISDLKKLKEDPSIPFPIASIKKKWNQLLINERVAYPIENYATFYEDKSDIAVKDLVGNQIGFLCFTRELGEIEMNELTENQFIAFLTEAKFADRHLSFKFLNNYLILNETFFKEYKDKHAKTSSLWGGFYHKEPDIPLNSYRKAISEIQISDLKFPSNIFYENSMRAISQPFAFERLLKLYHLLELRFDFDVIEKIKNLDINTDSDQIGKLLNDYSSKELKRLADILIKNCINIDPIVKRLNYIKNYPNQSHDIFYKFGKEGNPLDEMKFSAVISSGFEESNLRAKKVSLNVGYNKFIISLAAYWIYRIRCCVAHNKIGEYILSMSDETFVVEFAEPLLKELLIQCFKK